VTAAPSCISGFGAYLRGICHDDLCSTKTCGIAPSPRERITQSIVVDAAKAGSESRNARNIHSHSQPPTRGTILVGKGDQGVLIDTPCQFRKLPEYARHRILCPLTCAPLSRAQQAAQEGELQLHLNWVT